MTSETRPTSDKMYYAYNLQATQDQHNDEIWKAISEWPYEVSNLGRVRRIKKGTNGIGGSILKPQPCGPIIRGKARPYRFVLLSDAGRTCSISVHRLVANAFLGPRPDGYQIDHIDGDATNNAASNLRYTTVSENINGSVARGHRGKNRWNAVLTEERVQRARELYADGYTVNEIAGQYGCNPATLANAIARRTWRHVA